MKVELLPVEKLIPYARNPRITVHAVDKVAASIKEFGFRQPLVVDNEMVIIVGHVRYLAAQKLQLLQVPVHIAEGLSEAQVKAYRIADNRIGEEAQWDNELLSLELGDLSELSFDKSILGFEIAELEQLQKSLENLLNDGVGAEEDGEVSEADTHATIGAYHFEIEREVYLQWIEELRQKVGFEKEAIIAEIKRRLRL